MKKPTERWLDELEDKVMTIDSLNTLDQKARDIGQLALKVAQIRIERNMEVHNDRPKIVQG